MTTKSEQKTLTLTFTDEKGKKVNYSMQRPKANLDKAAVDDAAGKVLEAKVFATTEGDLTSFAASQVVTRKVEVFE